MLEIDLNPEKTEVVLSGPEVVQLVSGRHSTYLTIILGFRRENNGTLKLSDVGSLLPRFVQLVQLLKETGFPFRLSRHAKDGIAEWRDYLTVYGSALSRGKEINASEATALELPSDFRRELKPYQVTSVRHMATIPHAANFSVPGSGKTTIALASFSILKNEADVDKLFVIGPRSSFEPWEDEFQGCFGRKPRSARLIGTPDERAAIFLDAERYELFLAGYQMVANEVKNIISAFRRHSFMLVIDESHHLKKGGEGVWFQGAYSIAPYAKRRVILTGTPAPNSLTDLGAQFELLWPELYFLPTDLFPSRSGGPTMERTRELIRPLYVRIRKSQMNLPKKMISRILVPMGPVQSKVYRSLTHEILSRVAEDPETRIFIRELRRAIVVRLIQAASNPTLLSEFSEEFQIPPASHVGVGLGSLLREYSTYEVPSKFVRALDLANSIISQGRKVIIWNSFIHNVTILSNILLNEGVKHVAVTGLLPTENENENVSRDALLRQFKSDPEVKALVATTPSIAESVSLHKICKDAIYLDRTFNCGLYMQSMDRIHRVGLAPNDQIRYYLLLSADTIDGVIDKRLEEKMDVMYRLLDDDVGILDLDLPEDLTIDGVDGEDMVAVSRHLMDSQPGENDLKS